MRPRSPSGALTSPAHSSCPEPRGPPWLPAKAPPCFPGLRCKGQRDFPPIIALCLVTQTLSVSCISHRLAIKLNIPQWLFLEKSFSNTTRRSDV